MTDNLRTIAGRQRHARRVVEAIATESKLTVVDLLGPDRFSHFVAARRKIARKLVADGLNPYAIATALNRDRSTVLAYIHANGWEQKPNFRANRHHGLPVLAPGRALQCQT